MYDLLRANAGKNYMSAVKAEMGDGVRLILNLQRLLLNLGQPRNMDHFKKRLRIAFKGMVFQETPGVLTRGIVKKVFGSPYLGQQKCKSASTESSVILYTCM